MKTLNPASRKITQSDIDLYARLTNDANPIHIDPVFAATTPMGGVIAHGTMSVGLLWNVIEDMIAGEDYAARLKLRFTAPVRPDDTVTAGGKLADDGNSYLVWVRNQNGETVIEGELHLNGEQPS